MVHIIIGGQVSLVWLHPFSFFRNSISPCTKPVCKHIQFSVKSHYLFHKQYTTRYCLQNEDDAGRIPDPSDFFRKVWPCEAGVQTDRGSGIRSCTHTVHFWSGELIFFLGGGGGGHKPTCMLI